LSLHEEKVEDFLDHHKGRVKKCPYCEVVYFNILKKNASIIRHVKRYHKELFKDYAKNHSRHTNKLLGIEGDFKCPYCPQTWSTEQRRRAKMWKHVIDNHKDKVEEYAQNYEPERKYFCPSEGCLERFYYEKHMVTHAFESHEITITTDNTKPDIECPFCNEIFRSSSKIIAHLKTYHINEQENPIYTNVYNQHQKNEVCHHCGKVFRSMPIFLVHMRESHSDLFTEKCEICGKSYRSKESLQWHMKTHEESKSLCIECGKSYSNKHKLQSHIKQHHSNSNKSFTCSECFKICQSQSHLATHVRKLHLKEKVHPCKLCDKAFVSRQSIVAHMVAVHLKVKPFLCEFCNFECARIDNLCLHRKKSHGAEKMSQLQFLALVDSGKHPYYDQEKIKLLKSVCANEISLFQ